MRIDWCWIYTIQFEEDFPNSLVTVEDKDVHIVSNKYPTDCLVFDFTFNYLLIRLEKEFSIVQYQLACLSTLGGAYHLLNRPMKALQMAYHQEYLGRKLRSTEIIVRSKVFQAINFMLLGKKKFCQRMFKQCKELARQQETLLKFVGASEGWLSRNYGYSLCAE